MAVAVKRQAKRLARSFDILLPRLNRAEAGVVFAAGNYVRRVGVVPAKLQAARMPGGSIGVHAAAADGSESLCGLPLSSASGKDTAPLVAFTGSAAKAAPHVTCKFCQARLVAAGVLPASDATPYAADYGTREAEAELASIAARAAKAAKSNGKAGK